MLTFRQKLLLGFGPLLALFILASSLGISMNQSIADASQHLIQAADRHNDDALHQTAAFISNTTAKNTRYFTLITVGGIVITLLVMAWFARSLLAPVRDLSAFAHQVELGNLHPAIPAPTSRDEFSQFTNAFTSMLATFREARRTDDARFLKVQQITRQAIESLPHPIAVFNPAGEVEISNHAAARLVGLNVGATLSALNHKWLTTLFDRVTQTRRSYDPPAYTGAIQIFDGGAERFFLPHAAPLLDERDQILGITIILADITELRRIDEAKSDLIATVSHELKTPLTSIQMICHLLLEDATGPITPKQRDLLDTACADSHRLNQIIDNLLDMARMQAGNAQLDMQPVRPLDLIEESADPFRPAFTERNLTLNIQISPDLPAVHVDRLRIRHVLANLLSNAQKYTPPHGHIAITAASVGPNLRVSVTDTGPGVPQEYRERIFEKFFRVPGHENLPGAGLGLAIAKEIVTAHGGEILAEAGPTGGARITFTLPLATISGDFRTRATTPV